MRTLSVFALLTVAAILLYAVFPASLEPIVPIAYLVVLSIMLWAMLAEGTHVTKGYEMYEDEDHPLAMDYMVDDKSMV